MIKPRLFPAGGEVPHVSANIRSGRKACSWYGQDIEQGIFGFHRIGQECNANEGRGMVTSWNGIATRDGVRFAHDRADRRNKSFLLLFFKKEVLPVFYPGGIIAAVTP